MKHTSSEELIEEIKRKKELSGLSSSLIKSQLEDFAKKSKIDLSGLSSRDKKLVVKEIRKNLRVISGQFQKSVKDRKEFLKSKDFVALIESHSSTAERINFYPELKRIISEIKPSSILDLGCGINPLFLARREVTYFAADIKEDELSLIKEFFKIKKINGEAFYYDLKSPATDLPSADLCLIFKVLDILKDKKLAEKIILTLDCKKIIASFSTKKLSGKKMNFPKRVWFEKMLSRNNLFYSTFSSPNEFFYVIEKS